MKTGLQFPILICLLASAAQATDPVFSTILSGDGQEYASAVASDAQGNVFVAGRTYSPHFPVTAGAVQTTFGGTCDAFVAKIGPDGKPIWSTYLGGLLDDWATGIALDSAGNVLVTGWTRSANFPLAKALQGTLNSGASLSDFDAFVLKLDPTGTKLLYSTFLGGQNNDGATGIAVDSAGNAYVAVFSSSATGFPGLQNAPDQIGIVVSKLDPQGGLTYSFFHPYGADPVGSTDGGIAVDAAGSAYVTGSSSSLDPATATKSFGPSGIAYAFVFKLSPDGSKKIYETALGGSVRAAGAAIAVDSAGEVWVAGSTSSADFPLARPLQSSPGARPVWKSTDFGTTWTPLDDLPFALPQMLVVDPTNSRLIYQGTGDLGIFKSLDGGATWAKAATGIAGTNVQALAIDPVHPQTLYAAMAVAHTNGAASSVVYKTVNGANSWTPIDSPPTAISQLSVDAQNPNIVWEIGVNLRKSTDAGATWNPVAFPGPTVVAMTLDPGVSGHLFAVSGFVFCSFNCGNTPTVPYFYRSVDGGANWIQMFPSSAPSAALIVDASTNPSTVYDGIALRSVDGGINFSPITPPPGTSPTLLAVDPSGALYAVSSQGIFVSHDHAQTWSAIGSFIPSQTSGPGAAGYINSIVPAGSTGTLYATTFTTNHPATSGFVSELSADGSSLMFSTYLRGHQSWESSAVLAGGPGVLLTNNAVSGIVLDAAGNATVVGGTRASDWTTANPSQAATGGLADAFVTTISADGNKLNYSTYLGGSKDDAALAVALDSQGNVIVAGQTFSPDFPVPGGSPLTFSYGDAFVVKLATGPPAITTVLNGASFQPGIEAGSWVMIKGSNLANTTRTWRADDFVNGALPASLDGASVTINGKPAFVYYISPKQINVQAPSDSALGTVNVVVNNNGALSAPATAQLQTVAPAFFLEPGTNNAIASRLPDYAAVGDPSAPAKPGDIIVLWGTGFGATAPPVAAGIAVSGAPGVLVLPVVTVGRVPAQVISTILTVGSAGLYQVTIRIPDTVAAGPVVVQASVGVLSSPGGVLLFVTKQ